MSNQERLMAIGRVGEKQREALSMRLKMEGLRDSIRVCLDRYEPIEAIRANVAAQQAVELAGLQRAYRDLLEEIAAIKRDWDLQ